jgi:hypothetical protein
VNQSCLPKSKRLLPRWHHDSDGWVWRVYEGNVVDKGVEERTTNIYIVPLGGELWIINADKLMKGGDWIAEVEAGRVARIAGPFDTMDAAKAAWRIIYG